MLPFQILLGLLLSQSFAFADIDYQELMKCNASIPHRMNPKIDKNSENKIISEIPGVLLDKGDPVAIKGSRKVRLEGRRSRLVDGEGCYYFSGQMAYFLPLSKKGSEKACEIQQPVEGTRKSRAFKYSIDAKGAEEVKSDLVWSGLENTRSQPAEALDDTSKQILDSFMYSKVRSLLKKISATMADYDKMISEDPHRKQTFEKQKRNFEISYVETVAALKKCKGGSTQFMQTLKEEIAHLEKFRLRLFPAKVGSSQIELKEQRERESKSGI